MQCKSPVIGKQGNYLYIRPCGQCLQCRINDCRNWYVRSFFEFKKVDRPFHYFLTLTFDDGCLPKDNICTKPELKAFLNNLNTSFGLHMRYYGTSDYGSLNGRPHYHVIFSSEKKVTSKQCERLWKKGFIKLKPLCDENIKYTLRYTVKKIPFENGDKKNFRLVSKGWGDNAGEYYTGQEYFLIKGKKYGICRYLAEKIGVEPSNEVKVKYYDLLKTRYPKLDFYDISVCDTKKEDERLTEIKDYLRKISTKELL